MRTVGIRELKAQLSSALREVQRGEVILVTDRGRVIAELRTPGSAPASDHPADRALARLASDGRLRVAERGGAEYRVSPLSARPGLARELLDEDRGE
ncbi:MAG: type II toxin-antitoxin system prevent-host-death family antitoxin [Gemmatimonadaceae bacterium]